MSEPFPYSTLVEMLHYWSSHEPHKPAFIFVDKHRTRVELSRGQLYQLGGRWAAVLQEDGVGRKDRVVSTLPNGPERALCDVGIVMAGAVMVNAQCQLEDGSDLLHILRQVSARAVCVNPDLDTGPWQVLKQHVQHDPVTNTVTSDSLPDLRKVFFIRRTAPLCQDSVHVSEASTKNSDSALKDDERTTQPKDGFSCPETGDFIASLKSMEKVHAEDVAAEETVIVLTTSGSTGFSKLVPYTHSFVLGTFHTLKRVTANSSPIEFNNSPLGWIGGLTFFYLVHGKGRLLDMWYGAPDDLAAVVWDSIVQEGCHAAIMLPFLVSRILALESRQNWKMKSILTGGHPIHTKEVQQALQLAETVFICYGPTELPFFSFCSVSDVSQYQDFCIGKPVPNNSAKVCDPAGNEVPRGTKGQIYGKSANMFKGYLNSADATEASFTADGFLKTGDIGVMLEDGSLVVGGRRGDAIQRGGYIIYPGWLESRILHCCSGLQNVFVVGVPDPQMGEELCACFVPSDPSVTEDDVRSLVEKDIQAPVEDPMSPRPRYYLSFQAFPTSTTSKPVRKDVRREATQRLNLA